MATVVLKTTVIKDVIMYENNENQNNYFTKIVLKTLFPLLHLQIHCNVLQEHGLA